MDEKNEDLKVLGLTNKQFELLMIARENGYVSVSDAYVVYSSRSARVNALKLLVKRGFLRVSVVSPNRFEFVRC